MQTACQFGDGLWLVLCEIRLTIQIEEGDIAKGLDINFQWSFQLILGRKLQRLIKGRDKSYKN